MNWCKMKILVMLSPSVKTRYLKIFQFSGNFGKARQNNPKMFLFWIWDNLHHLVWSVRFIEAAGHLSTFTKINVLPQVYLCLITRQMISNCKTHHICAFFAFKETLVRDFMEMNFHKIVLVAILWDIMSGNGLVVELWIKKLLNNKIAWFFQLKFLFDHAAIWND